MKSLILLLALVLPAQSQSLYPQNWKPYTVSQWGGLNLLVDSTAIGIDAQKAQNVLTDSGFLEKRTGNIRLGTILSGYPVTFVDDWVTPSGSRYLIGQASTTLYQTNFSGNPVALSTLPAGYGLSSVAVFSRRIFADGARPLWYWDGTSTGTVKDTASNNTAPICSHIVTKDSRIFCANIPNEGTSRVRVSSAGGAGYWTVPANFANIDNAPNVFDFTPDDGDYVRCIAATPWGVWVGKGFSSSIIKGNGNLSYELRSVDPKVGCVNQRSVQMVDGKLRWLSYDGVYQYDGAGPPRPISREIDPLLKTIVDATSGARSWLVDTQLDFSAGNLTGSGPGAPMSATVSPGSLTPSTFSVVETSSGDFTRGTLVNLSTTVAGALVMLRASSASFTNAGAETDASLNWQTQGFSRSVGSCSRYGSAGWVGTASFTCSPTLVNLQITNASSVTLATHVIPVERLQGPIEYTINTSTLPSSQLAVFMSIGSDQARSVPFVKSEYLKLKIDIGSSQSDPACLVCWDIDESNPSTWTVTANQYSATYDTTFTTPTYGSITVDISSSTKETILLEAQTAPTVSGPWRKQSRTNGQQITLNDRFVRYLSSWTITGATVTPPAFYSGSLAAAPTGYYYSEVHFIGTAITTFTVLTVSQDAPDGSTVTYQVRTATYAFTDFTNIPWVNQTANNTIALTASTPTYFQWRSLLDFRSFETRPTITRAQTGWLEGSERPVASGAQDRRYFLCVAVSTASTTPDTCLVLQKNGKWVTWTGPSIGSMGMYNNNLIVGDGSTDSRVWKIMQLGVYQDDAEAIDSQWITGDFTGSMLFNPKVLHEIWVDALPVQMSSVTVSFLADKYGDWTDKTVSLDTGYSVNNDFYPVSTSLLGYINKQIPLSSGYKKAKYFRFKFSDNSVNSYFRINAYQPFIEDQPRQVP